MAEWELLLLYIIIHPEIKPLDDVILSNSATFAEKKKKNTLIFFLFFQAMNELAQK